MCGIAAVARVRGLEKRQSIADLAGLGLAHRGPDDEGSFKDAWVELVHRRLSIIDTSRAGRQPMQYGERYVFVYNGELYNYLSLRKCLREEGCEFRSDTDSEVALQTLVKWGVKAVARWEGMFAWVLWDRKEGELLWCRDQFGIKPLYEERTSDGVSLASELRTLLSLTPTRRSLDTNGLASVLSGVPYSKNRTLVNGIQQARPGVVYRWSKLTNETQEIFEIPTLWAGSVGNPNEELVRSLEEQLRADVPVAILLSGGVDSSLLTCLAAKELGRKVTTVTVGLPGATDVDMFYAKKIAASFSQETICIGTESVDPKTLFQEWMGAVDYPSIDGLNTFLVSRELKKAGIKVALSGLGADEMLGGYERTFKRLPKLNKYSKYAPFISDILRRCSHFTPRTKLVELLEAGCDLERAYCAMRSYSPFSVINDLLESRHGYPPKYELNARDTLGQPHEADDVVISLSLLEMTGYMRHVLLRDTDQMSMFNSVEIRVPFVSRRFWKSVVLARSNTVSTELKREFVSRYWKSVVPNEILQRRKTGFSLPLEDWVNGVWRDQMLSGIDHASSWVSPDLAKIKELFLKRTVKWPLVLSIAVLGHWCNNNGRYIMKRSE